jgi:hypothetical protein
MERFPTGQPFRVEPRGVDNGGQVLVLTPAGRRLVFLLHDWTAGLAPPWFLDVGPDLSQV